MNRPHHRHYERPIFGSNVPNTLHSAKLMTENKGMPKGNNHSYRVILVKGEQQWRFEWELGQETRTIQAITEIAESPDTDFDWFDAAMVCHEMSKITTKAA